MTTRTPTWLAVLLLANSLSAADSVDCDLLIVGGNEAGVAAAVQAARLGVPRIVLVNDIAWLGGQFSAEGVGCIDEWTTYRGKRVNFPRSGLFLEVIHRIRRRNAEKYGLTNPGNAWCGTDTIEPAEAARIFEELLAPYQTAVPGQGQVTYLQPWEPVRVVVDRNSVRAVEFARPDDIGRRLTVRAKLTIDSSDWGDVVRMSGAKYAAGPDLQSRFGEPSAPVGPLGDDRNEMNPLSWCVVLREAGRDATIPAPEGYQPRSFSALDAIPPFVDADMSEGIYTPGGWSVYTHRRLVDRWHNRLPGGTEATFLNWPTQDYPLFNFPQHVIDALEANERGASGKNIVNMTPAQRRIVFNDARRHALGMLHYLQTKVHDRVGDYPQSFRYMGLTDEFGTSDRLPPKPYIREGLRLEALYMLREQDIRAADRHPNWAKVMVPDAVFGFQFNIDFHPTRRRFLDPGPEAARGPWQFVHTLNRHWHTDTDRAMLPLRSLVPVERDGLLGTSKNIGVSSLVSSAVRVHGQMMHCGQAAGTTAWMCLRDEIQPRELARDWQRIRELQQHLVRAPRGAPGILLWPYHDLAVDDLHFEAVNLLGVRGIWQGDADSLDFDPYRSVTSRELARILEGVAQHVVVPIPEAEFDALLTTGETPADWQKLADGLQALGLSPSPGLTKGGPVAETRLTLQRHELARMLWAHIKNLPERLPYVSRYLEPGHDTDSDGTVDLDDPLPLTNR
ncbi:MAG: FAD-dependent oxidoreductase [Planctomycetaceae bacterium]|nr:FAD-dependent oxidoreductase [Planctomycetaceae bacterium]